MNIISGLTKEVYSLCMDNHKKKDEKKAVEKPKDKGVNISVRPRRPSCCPIR